MKAAVFYGKHDLRIEEIPMPRAQKGEVVIKVMACGICGTDVHIFNGDEGAAPTPAGTVLGHEFAGIVTEVGEGVSSVSVGDHVSVDPNELCGEYYYCLSGIGHLCEHMTGYGTTKNGGFAEYCAVPASQVYRVKNETAFTSAAMNEPLACCLHGIDMCDIAAGDTVAVIGGGMIGLLMLSLAKSRGAARLILLEPVAEKRALGERLGATLTIDPLGEDTEAVLAAHGIDRISTVIECVGRPSTMAQAIRIAGKKSTVMLFGLTAPDDTIAIKPFEIFKKEITLRASFINPYTQKRALSLIENGAIDVASMIGETAPLAELPAILADPQRRAKGKIVILPNGGEVR